MKIRIARKILTNVQRVMKDKNSKCPQYGHCTFWRALVRMNQTPEWFKHQHKLHEQFMLNAEKHIEDLKTTMAKFGMPLDGSVPIEKLEEIC